MIVNLRYAPDIFLFVLCGLVTSVGGAEATDPLNAVAERYAHLVLALGQHDPDYVDAFYGSAEAVCDSKKETRYRVSREKRGRI